MKVKSCWSFEHNTSKYRLEKCQVNIGSNGTHSVLDTPDLWANIVVYVTVEFPIDILKHRFRKGVKGRGGDWGGLRVSRFVQYEWLQDLLKNTGSTVYAFFSRLLTVTICELLYDFLDLFDLIIYSSKHITSLSVLIITAGLAVNKYRHLVKDCMRDT